MMIELIATAESVAQAKELVDCGVDILYIGEDEYGLRLPYSFTREEQREVIAYAHEKGAQVSAALTGRIITFFLPEDSPGLILEMPVYRMPTIKTVTAKAWFRIREFIFEAWPVLIVGSIVLAVLNYFSITQYINALTQPLNWLLGLPKEVGTPLVFGVFRKELSLVMLAQAFGTSDYAAVMTHEQMMVFTVFVVFYIPCLATMIAIRGELGGKAMWAITALTILVATIAALAVRLVFVFF